MEEQIQRSNLSSALYLAIRSLEEREKAARYTGPPELLAGFQRSEEENRQRGMQFNLHQRLTDHSCHCLYNTDIATTFYP